jgi:hypothetical protein
MVDFKIGTYPPMCPRGIFLEKQIRQALVGKTIINTAWEKYYIGNYSWHGGFIQGFDNLYDHKIIFADASYILTHKGSLIFYAYLDSGLRYFNKGEELNIQKAVKPATHGYHAKIFLDDGSCLGINLYGWATLLKVFEADLEQINDQRSNKNGRYPFLPKSYIDVTDEEEFTYTKFMDWLSANPSSNVIESCSTVKGAFRIDNPVMNYILLISKVHPKTKVRALTETEVRAIYDNTFKIIGEYKAETRVCAHTDIYGNTVQSHNDVIWMNSSVFYTPCPSCGTLIDATPAAGTKMYYCPSCQVIKK